MPLAVEEAVQCIDRQICHFSDLIRNLKSQRNMLANISRLPTEILCRIFHEVRGNKDRGRGYFQFWKIESYSEPNLDWISVSHVSRHWRSVAIDDASLWTDPPLKNPAWTTTMLERSRMVTIPEMTLKVKELKEQVVATLMPHIPRVASLVIPQMDREALKSFLSSLPSTSLNLEMLSIGSLTKATAGRFTWYYGATSVLYAEAVVFPEDVLRHAPKLQHLQLNGIIVKSDSPLLTSLTTLSMSGVPTKSKPTSHQFKTMLASAPYLKKLFLKGVCPLGDSDSQTGRTAPVLMRYLECLDIDEDVSRLIFFLKSISATHLLTEVKANADCTLGKTMDLSLLLAALSQPYLQSVSGSSPDVRRLAVIKSHGQFEVHLSKLSIVERNIEPDKRNGFDWDDTNPDTMAFSIETSLELTEEDDLRRAADTLLSCLFENMMWSGLCELDLTSLFYASAQVLESTFGTVPQLRIIIANEHISPDLIEALSRPSDRISNPSGSMPLSFPGLQHINMGDTTFTKGTLKALRKCLQMRHRFGVPIISLKFDHNDCEVDAVLLLKEYVEHIILQPSGSEHTVVDDFSPYHYDWYL